SKFLASPVNRDSSSATSMPSPPEVLAEPGVRLSQQPEDEAAQGGPGLVEDLGGRDVVDRREVGHHEVPAGQDVPPVGGSPWTLAARARDALWRGFVPLVEARFRVVL